MLIYKIKTKMPECIWCRGRTRRRFPLGEWWLCKVKWEHKRRFKIWAAMLANLLLTLVRSKVKRK